MKNFDARYNDIPKIEIHIHLEGSMRTQTIIDIGREYQLNLPSYLPDAEKSKIWEKYFR